MTITQGHPEDWADIDPTEFASAVTRAREALRAQQPIDSEDDSPEELSGN